MSETVTYCRPDIIVRINARKNRSFCGFLAINYLRYQCTHTAHKMHVKHVTSKGKQGNAEICRKTKILNEQFCEFRES